MVARVYKDESELEGYIRSDLYGINDHTRYSVFLPYSLRNECCFDSDNCCHWSTICWVASLLTSTTTSHSPYSWSFMCTSWQFCFFRNLSNPIILGAIVFHAQGPQLFDYSIRLNHTWAFSGFPDVHTIMDVNGPYLNDLELGMTIVPTLQYGLSGFLTVWIFFPSINLWT